MGPRPNGRGKAAAAVMAAAPPGVNGAAAKRPRKVVKDVDSSPVRFSRQWGRGQTAAERTGTLRTAASMTCVNGAAAKRPRKVCVRSGPCPLFLRQWGRGQTAAESRRRGTRSATSARASMGPRPNGRGKSHGSNSLWPSGLRQWGRGQTAAESPSPTSGLVRSRASMGPRPNGRGKRKPA